MTKRVEDFISVYIDDIDKEDWDALFRGMFEEAVLHDNQCNEVFAILRDIGIDLNEHRKEWLYNYIVNRHTSGKVDLSEVFNHVRYPYTNTLGITLQNFMSTLRIHDAKITFDKNQHLLAEFKR